MHVRPRNLLNAILRNKCIRISFGLIFGVLLGIGLFELALVDLDFENTVSFWLVLTVCLILAVGNAFSIQILCISFLTLPSICGRAGRSALKALIITFILAGPIKNLSINAWEVVDMFSCATELTYNLTKSRFDLIQKPFQEAVLNMKKDVTELKDTTKSVNNLVGVISSEIEDKQEAEDYLEYNDYFEESQGGIKRSLEAVEKNKNKEDDISAQVYEKIYIKKLNKRCDEILSRGTERCHDIFKDAFNSCYDKVSPIAAWLLCWPMKLTFVCNIKQAMSNGTRACDAAKEIEPDFGGSFVSMKKAGKMLKGESGGYEDIKIKYKPIEYIPPLEVSDVKDMVENLQEDFKNKRSVFDTISVIIRRLLSLIFLKVILEAQKYHEKYLEDLSHDNCWITSYFLHIDDRRNIVGKSVILPLKKAERGYLRYPSSLIPRNLEIRGIVLKFAITLLETSTATVIILLDQLMFDILQIVKKHSRIDYSQEGTHGLTVKVKGSGMMAKLVKSLLRGFHIKQEVYSMRSNYECLPNPRKMSSVYLYKIYGTYLIILLLIITEGYTNRLKRMICAAFYEKKEKQRILHLYSQCLRRRAKLIKNTTVVVKERFKEVKRILNMKMNFLLYLRFHHPKYLGWLKKITAIAQLQCLICGQHEGRKGLTITRKPSKEGKDWDLENGADKWHVCEKSNCDALYCMECWKDIENICCVCSVAFSPDVSYDEVEIHESEREF